MTDSQAQKKSMRLTIIVPAYNERATIGEILKKVRAQKIYNVEIEIAVVDDGSNDGTREFLDENPHLYDLFLKNPRNLGKGGSVKRALEATSGDYVLFQDADLEYNPSDYKKLITPVFNFNADVVMGSRFLAPSWTRVFYFWHKIGNSIVTIWFNLLYNKAWTDVYSCYLLFKRDLISPEELRSMRWQQHAEILGKVCLRGKQFYEVPISYNGRTYEEGKKIRWHHTLSVLFTMLKVRILH